MRAIVTGATGFIGREIVKEVENGGATVFQVGRKQKNTLESSVKSTKELFFEVDIVSYENFDRLKNLENIDAVIHSAGLAHQFGEISEKQFNEVNVDGTENVLRLAVELNAKQFILVSSTAVYGIKYSDDRKDSKRKPVIIDEDTECKPETLYAQSKLAAEQLAITTCRRHALPLTILRLSPVVGEGSAGNAARLIDAVRRRRFFWIGKGQNLKTLIYKGDVAAAVGVILKNKRMDPANQPEIFNLAAPPLTMSDLVGEIKKCVHQNIPKFYIPPTLLQIIIAVNDKTIKLKRIRKVSDTLEKWLSDDVYSGQKIKQAYDFEPTTTIAEAIEKQAAYYFKENGKN